MYNWISEHEYLLTSSGTFPELHSFLGLIFIKLNCCILWTLDILYDIVSILSCFYILILHFVLYGVFLCIIFVCGVTDWDVGWSKDKLLVYRSLPDTLYVIYQSLSLKKKNHFQYFVFDKFTNWHSLIVLPSRAFNSFLCLHVSALMLGTDRGKAIMDYTVAPRRSKFPQN